MTFPLYLAAHLVYGALMAWAMERRLRSEGEILGVPLVVTLLPVAFVSAPIGAVCVRWAGTWFLHGAFQAGGAYAFERYHLGIMVGVAFLAGVATVFGLFVAIAFLSRDARRLAGAPYGLAAIAVAAVVLLDGRALVEVTGSGRMIWNHPVGALTLVLVVGLAAAWLVCRRKLSAPVQRIA